MITMTMIIMTISASETLAAAESLAARAQL